jgi:26S proteasome regulatory subunit N12
LKAALQSNDLGKANSELNKLKGVMLDMDSLPPMSVETPTAAAERLAAREVLEWAVFLSIKNEDSSSFARSVASLRPYYEKGMGQAMPTSENENTVLGLNLMYLLVENKLAEFHSELELLNDEQLKCAPIAFCTQLDQHLNLGSYDQVLSAAKNPPVDYYQFFLRSLLDTVRINIGDCAAASYSKLTVDAATSVLMFSSKEETLAFIKEEYPDWQIGDKEIDLRATKVVKSEEIDSKSLISQTLGYATELERIV